MSRHRQDRKGNRKNRGHQTGSQIEELDALRSKTVEQWESMTEESSDAFQSMKEELNAVFLGDKRVIKYGDDNLLFGKKTDFNLKPKKVPRYDLSVINMLGKIRWGNKKTGFTQNFLSSCKSSVIILVIKLPNMSGCCVHNSISSFVNEVETKLNFIQKCCGESVLAHTLILFTQGNNPAEFQDSLDIQNLIGKYSVKSCTCYEKMNKDREILRLVQIMRNDRYPRKPDSSGQSTKEQEEHSIKNQKEQEEEAGRLQEQQLQDKSKKKEQMRQMHKGTIQKKEITPNWHCNEGEGKKRTSKEKLYSKEETTQRKSIPVTAKNRDKEKLTRQMNEEQEGNVREQQEQQLQKKTKEKKLKAQAPGHETYIKEEKMQEKSSPVTAGIRDQNTSKDTSRSEARKEHVILILEPQRRTFSTISEQPDDSLENTKQLTLDSACGVLTRLDLQDKHPKRSGTETICTFMDLKEGSQTERKMAIYLQKLFMFNYRARFTPELMEDQDLPVSTLLNYRGENIENVVEVRQDRYTKESLLIHPMDVQMALFHCADNFLRQDIVTKLNFCQYAIPLLVPDPLSAKIELPLWTFQQIKKSWKSADGLSRTEPVCQIKAPLVSFYRLGSVSVSKSQMLNSLVNPRHDTFFHRDLPGGDRTPYFIKGLTEIAWYCPAGNNDDIFNECIAFCNLHGDATEHKKQAHFLNEKSTINVVLMQNLNLNDAGRVFLQKLHTSPKPLICIVNDQQKGPLKLSSHNIKIGLKGKNKSELHKDLITVINTCLQKYKSGPTFSLEKSLDLPKDHMITLDENDHECQKGNSRALKVMEMLQREEVSQIKDKFLPCQGKLWHEWTRKNKELYRLRGHIEKNKCKIQQQMEAIREQQRKSSTSDLINAFQHFNSSTEKRYFMKWLQVYLDRFFSEKLSEYIKEYYKQWTQVLYLKQQRIGSAELEKKQKQLETLSEEIYALTVGLEHIVREMGQIYEAWASLSDQMAAEVSSLPALAAELLISGHPLELMDGDAAHVPLIWIQSVLDSVIDRLRDQRVYVLSVLGLQSSGKSTMLNAMFGLQFAVSAGRCTRGAFMQLIEVKEQFREELKFDFLLVVDTEGLQALELTGKATFNHDNELATFVIGLANLTLINVLGENSAEIHGVLQIAIQALLRMKKVKLKPSCIFVHQNVTDIAAAEKNLEGRRRLQEKLDEMTVSIAKEVGCDANCFSDVITFDMQKDVHYFAQLWEGNPPMAPPNPCYSENIEKLKEDIFKAAAQQQPLRLSDLKVRIQDLWTAVLSEDFVFSFRNTLEIAAYKKLEVMYGNWTWTLRKDMITIENKLQNRIKNGKKVSERLIEKEILGTFCTIKMEIETFFAVDKDREILAQWRARTEERILELKNSLVEGTKVKFDQILHQKSKRQTLDKMITEYENELFTDIISLAFRRRGSIMDEEEFNSMWKKWFSGVMTDISRLKDINVEEEKVTQRQEAYREANDPLAYLQNKKGEFFALFKKAFKGATTDTLFAEFVVNKLKPSLLQAVCDKTAQDVAEEMMANFSAFNENRSTLEKHILQDLAEEENFKKYITYIHNPKEHFSDFIQKSVRKQMFEGKNPSIMPILNYVMNKEKDTVVTAIQKARREVKQNGEDVNVFLERFSQALKNEIKLNVGDLDAITLGYPIDTTLFSGAMEQALKSITNDLVTDIMSSGKRETIIQKVVEILNKQLCGCWVQCPFCKVICTNTIEGHDGDHSVPFHRPSGVNGWRTSESDNLSVNICTSLVTSDSYIPSAKGGRVPFKKYREAGADFACWSITPDFSALSYWKWFVCRFQEDLEKNYRCTFQKSGEIPSAWRKITKEKAIESLKR